MKEHDVDKDSRSNSEKIKTVVYYKPKMTLAVIMPINV